MGWGTNDNWSSLGFTELNPLRVLYNVAPEAVDGLLESCEIATFDKGESVIEPGQKNLYLYIILTGRLIVYIENDSSMTPVYLETGQTVGEMSVIDSSPTSAKVDAVAYTRLLKISEEKFWRLIDVSHQFAKNMLLLLANRMRMDDSIIRESISLKNRFEEQTTLDPLTTLNNRRWLDTNFPKIINRCNYGQQPLSIMMVDIDHFKGVNDTYGHLVGDEVLRVVAEIIKNSIRPNDFSCRYGGEEFIVIFPGTSHENAMIPAERLRLRIEEKTKEVALEKNIPAVTISGGIGSRSEESQDQESIVKVADQNLYKAKESGRNKIIS